MRSTREDVVPWSIAITYCLGEAEENFLRGKPARSFVGPVWLDDAQPIDEPGFRNMRLKLLNANIAANRVT